MGNRMKLLTSINGVALLAALSFGNGAAQASVAYNTNGWDGGIFFGASDGLAPGTWIGGAAPAYTGSLSTPWYADLTTGATDIVSNAGAHAAGADPLYELAVGPMGWNRMVPNSGMGHGADVGLISLTSAARSDHHRRCRLADAYRSHLGDPARIFTVSRLGHQHHRHHCCAKERVFY